MPAKPNKAKLITPQDLIRQVSTSSVFKKQLKPAASASATSPHHFEHVSEAAHPFLASMLAGHLAQLQPAANVWLLTPDVKSGERLHAELATWGAEALFLPESLNTDFDSALPDPDTLAERLSTLHHIHRSNQDGKGRLIVMPGLDFTEITPPPQSLSKNTLTLQLGDTLDLPALCQQLIDAGFEKNSQVFQRGQFAVRGGIFDLFELHHDSPVRIELFDQQVDSIREFDLDQQSSIRKIQSVELLLKLDEEENASATGQLADYRQNNDPVIALECSAPEATILILSGNKKTNLASEEDHTAAFYDNPLGTFEAGDFILQQSRHDQFIKQISEWKQDDWQVLIAFHSQGEMDRFDQLLAEAGITPSSLQHFIGDLNQGFTIPDIKIAVLSDAEIFGRYQHQRSRRKFTQARARSLHLQATQPGEFKIGDRVVHADYGIGRYRGLQPHSPDPADDDAFVEETLIIEYANEARLYVPLDQAHLVSRYIGSGKKAPPLNRLGDKRWNTTKEKAQRSIRDYAAQLLGVHAEREAKQGFAHSPDSKWQREFENAFIYQETPDQLTSIAATKEDMESQRPMDRLICGDVGFGKTEIAIRAAFKAVMSGKQVALLCPTTVLAQQHYQNFRERMSDFPIHVSLLSRYRSAAQQRETIQTLQQGSGDIVIGTHRLISKDVSFKNLGLVIIDEEQRFGVKHKERFKEMFRLVDVLTLSATPIPRTLYLSLMGARDMSTIDTPPPNRFAVKTSICPYDPSLIAKAIQRELKRQGQVFFLHNRVQSIEGVSKKIAALCPGARIAIGHGQMQDGELEGIMRRFINGEIDVLVCTTIIESGIDIPNANTIIIDRADRFGLADLYQLRGRVGRADHQAYALLLLPEDMVTEGDARKRINAIKQYSSLGAGFKIAMRDLEIRGAGNLLGTRQSGHIAAIGFDLYCQLLKQSVGKMQGDSTLSRIEVSFHIDFICTSEAQYLQAPKDSLPAYIPASYMPDSQLRISAYRQLAELTKLSEHEDLIENWQDRFGNMPPAILYLLTCSELRLRAALFGISALEIRDNKLMLSKKGGFLQVKGRFPRLKGKNQAKRLENALELIKSL
ncbi:MAG: transcription-repair coupling factor [Verrucomicrobiales bacterium]|nr:transcription-repair coupling factor [Verrucomicrobiales bacterium]